MSKTISGKEAIELAVVEETDSMSNELNTSAEILGTAMLLFFGCMGVCVPKLVDIPIPPQFGAITFGLTVLTIIQALGHISGAHLNPQVTLAALILNVIKPICVPVYIAAQFIGACVGFGLLKVVVPSQYSDGLCETLPERNMTDIQALVVEAVLTGGLILCCAAVWDSRNSRNTDSTPIRFGLVVTCLSMAGGSFTGASMNTARTFAPILINGNWIANQWVYWLGPTLGSVIAALLYRCVLDAKKNSKLCCR